jgi:hypothetical protein
MSWRINRYNKKSSKRFGWHPNWFGTFLEDFNDLLTKAIKSFQKRHEIEVDGLVGPQTFRRILTSRPEEVKQKNHILINGSSVPIDWDVKIDLMKPSCYRQHGYKRKPNMIVTHWDATTSAAKCRRVLEARNISTHFCIDNDGIIYQYVDTNSTAWHARGVNKYSVGIDFSNAYYLKYQDRYTSHMGLNARPICKDSMVHGVKLKPHLGYYPVQVEAYKKLVKVLCDHYNIPLKVPVDGSNKLLTKVHKESASGRFKGIVCHYHLTRNKIDCAGLRLKRIIDSLC